MPRLICESCNHGYAPEAKHCFWCGADSVFAYTSKAESHFDTECYANFWLIKFSTGESFELHTNTQLDVKSLTQTLSQYTLYSFNGIGYDVPMIAKALTGATCLELKQYSDSIIKDGIKHWNLPGIPWLDHIDMLEVAPGSGSQKSYGARMHMPVLQDLPYDPDAILTWDQKCNIRTYCDYDIDTLKKLCETLAAAIQLRNHISKTSSLDVRSKSGPQIAEALFKQIIGRKVEKPFYPAGTQFYFKPASWMKFIDLDVLDVLAQCPFTITDTLKVKMADELDNLVITIGDTQYQMGMGGLHSKEESISHVEDANYSLGDHDVGSYYPATIINTEIYPEQLGSIFKRIYKQWRDDRIEDKRHGRVDDADAKKLLLNGTFGKLFEQYSIFFAPKEGVQVTLTGQLALLMLIESLEQWGISVVSANTDGIVIKCHRALHPIRDTLLHNWESITGYELEQTEYQAIYSRDVNNYIAIAKSGKVKCKGTFAAPVPTASNWPAPSGQICVDAIVSHLTKQIPIESTITNCTDIRQFIYVRTVKGGGEITDKPSFPKKPSKRFAAEVLQRYGFESYEQALKWSQGGGRYLGKMVRWYYAKNSQQSIKYVGSGNLVPRTQGCQEAMTLPETLPEDIDYDWYINETKSLMEDIGCTTKHEAK